MNIDFLNFLSAIGLSKGHNIIVHSGFRSIKEAFAGITIEQVVSALQKAVGSNGSIIMPAFTYCFEKKEGSGNRFDRLHSKSLVGAVTEVFRKSPGVVRTSAPTHSFSVWGEAAEHFDESNSPASPLGKGSILQWLAERNDSYILMLGADFSSLTFIHYLEIIYEVPWYSVNPWADLTDPPVGLSINKTQQLKDAPGCSKNFTSLEAFLQNIGSIQRSPMGTSFAYYISIKKLLIDSAQFMRQKPLELLCPAGTCPACDVRRNYYHTTHSNTDEGAK